MFIAGLAIGVYGLLSMAGVVSRIETLQATGGTTFVDEESLILSHISVIAIGLILTVAGIFVATKASAIKRLGL